MLEEAATPRVHEGRVCREGRDEPYAMVIPSGLEPETVCLEGRCSIQLSYGTSCGLFRGAKVVREGGSWKSKVNIQNLSSEAGLFIVETAAGDNSEARMEGFIFGDMTKKKQEGASARWTKVMVRFVEAFLILAGCFSASQATGQDTLFAPSVRGQWLENSSYVVDFNGEGENSALGGL